VQISQNRFPDAFLTNIGYKSENHLIKIAQNVCGIVLKNLELTKIAGQTIDKTKFHG
jgi:hypothetical protein